MSKTQKSGKFQKVITIIEVVLVVICIAISILVITNSNKIKDNGSAKYAKFMTVQSDSMTPTIKESAVVITQKPYCDDDGEYYDLGTIVSFVDNSNGISFFNTHRIVGYRYTSSSVSGIQTYYYNKATGIDSWQEFSAQNSDAYFHSYITRGDKYTVECGDDKLENFGLTEGDIDVTSKDDAHYHQNNDIVAVYKGKIGLLGSVLKWLRSIWGFIITVLLPLLALLVINIVSVVKIIIKSRVEKAKADSAIDELSTKRQAIIDYLVSTGMSTEDATAKAFEQIPDPVAVSEEPTNEPTNPTDPSVE